MVEYTYDSIIEMIHSASPEARRIGVFTCDHNTLLHLRCMNDASGGYLVASPMQKNEPMKMFGFPVLEKIGHDGLTFGLDGGVAT